jgi:hypothetical protein
MASMSTTIMDFITEFYNKYSIYIYIENLTKMERCVLYQMIKHEVDCFDLRFRESHYNKENYTVMFSHSIFCPEKLNKDELFIDLRINIVDESDIQRPFSKYMEERDGEIFNNHNWDMINKGEVRKHYFS